MTTGNEPTDKASRKLLDGFFERHPNEDLRERARQALDALLGQMTAMGGAPGGWAGGIVYAVGGTGCGVPGVMNADLEAAFGTTMGTIRRRAEQVRQALGLDAPLATEGLPPCDEFTVRDEANAICAYAFRDQGVGEPGEAASHEAGHVGRIRPVHPRLPSQVLPPMGTVVQARSACAHKAGLVRGGRPGP